MPQRTLLASVLAWCLSPLSSVVSVLRESLSLGLARAEQELEAVGTCELPGELGDCAGSVL